jgi:hypothetical protein
MTDGAIQPPATADATLAGGRALIDLGRKYLLNDNWCRRPIRYRASALPAVVVLVVSVCGVPSNVRVDRSLSGMVDAHGY